MVSQSIQIRAPLKTVYETILDFESYPRFLNEMKKVKIGWIEDKQMEVTFTIQLIKEITYTLSFDLDPPRGIHWRLKSGEMMKKNIGSWDLALLDDDRTEAKYSIDIDFSLWVPKAITQTLVEKSLPKTLKAFKKRAEKSYRNSLY